LTATFQGTKRQRAPEDPFQNPGFRSQESGGIPSETTLLTQKQAFSDADRYQRIVMNDLESIIWGLIMMWASLSTMGDSTTTQVTAIIFLIARVGHTICYLFQLMPWRSIFWVVGVICNFTFAINTIYGAFNNN